MRAISKLLGLLGVLGLALLVAAPCPAQTTGTRPPTLRERLVAGLQVRRPSEFAFIDAVIDTVNRGELPRKLVDRFFFWARSKPATSQSTKRPIIYFEQGLKVLAKQQRITIAKTPPPSPSP